MTRTYTKVQREKPYPAPQSEREDLQNMLWSVGVAIPGSSNPDFMEIQELRDLVAWQMEKVATEPEFRKGYITEDAREGFREYLRWRDRRKMGALQFSMPGIPHQELSKSQE